VELPEYIPKDKKEESEREGRETGILRLGYLSAPLKTKRRKVRGEGDGVT
jgi:hypothetical protein